MPKPGTFQSAVAAALCRRTLPQARDWRATRDRHSSASGRAQNSRLISLIQPRDQIH